jgi:hypothetical protein
MGKVEKVNNMSEAEKPNNMSKADNKNDMIKADKSNDMDKDSIFESDCGSSDSASTFSKSSMPPPYFATHFITPKSFKAVIAAKLDDPAVSLFRLGMRVLQFVFALASGISYAIELDHRYSASSANFIYAEIVFGLTLLALIVYTVTVRYYRYTWVLEWALAVLWMACFGVFYNVYLSGEVAADYAVVDFGRMDLAVWCNLVNGLLWLGSAVFSTVIGWSGFKAAVMGKLEERRLRKEDKNVVEKTENMETGAVASGQV